MGKRNWIIPYIYGEFQSTCFFNYSWCELRFISSLINLFLWNSSRNSRKPCLFLPTLSFTHVIFERLISETVHFPLVICSLYLGQKRLLDSVASLNNLNSKYLKVRWTKQAKTKWLLNLHNRFTHSTCLKKKKGQKNHVVFLFPSTSATVFWA